jgi:Nuclear transport factor 2 (NTF2) domain
MQSQVDAEQKPMSYTQMFQLLPDGAGSYYVYNDVFRLVYAAS